MDFSAFAQEAEMKKSARVKCPFYKRHEDRRIVCEGITDGNTVHMVFEAGTRREKYMATRCASMGGYKNCRVFEAVMKKYDM